MAKNITLMGANYPDVPAVQLPQTGGGMATFYDINVVDNLNSDSSTDALSAKQGKELNTKKENKMTGLACARYSEEPYHNTTKSAISDDLIAKFGGHHFVVFSPLYDMTDGTTAGWYLIWRDGTMSGTTQFIKLA